jgi:predicted RNA binding protein YcfA (HicA-like mRNA interferase family)
MQPLKVRDARRLITKAGGAIREGGSHLKVTHPSLPQTFHLPTHGSKGRPTLSPGMTHEFHKFHALMMEARGAA